MCRRAGEHFCWMQCRKSAYLRAVLDFIALVLLHIWHSCALPGRPTEPLQPFHRKGPPAFYNLLLSWEALDDTILTTVSLATAFSSNKINDHEVSLCLSLSTASCMYSEDKYSGKAHILERHLGKHSHFLKNSLLDAVMTIATEKPINKINKCNTTANQEKKAIAMLASLQLLQNPKQTNQFCFPSYLFILFPRPFP